MRNIGASGRGYDVSAGLRRSALTIEAIVLLLMVSVLTLATDRDGIGNRVEPLRVPTGLPAEGAEIGERYIMINTDSKVVQLLSAPGGDSIRSWPNGTTMTVVSPEKEVDHMAWANLEDPEGNIGWAPSKYCYTWLPGGWVVK